MSKSAPLRVLLVTNAYAPSPVIGGRRMEHLAAGLHARGHEVTVLTVTEATLRSVDRRIAVPPGPRVIRAPAIHWRDLIGKLPGAARAPETASDSVAGPTATRPRRTLRGRAKRVVRAAGQRALVPLRDPDDWAGWVLPAFLRGLPERPDVVVATCPHASNFRAGARLARAVGARLVLDYRDPLSSLWSRRDDVWLPAIPTSRITRRERRWWQQADACVAVTPTIRAWLVEDGAPNVHEIANGAPLDALQTASTAAPASGPVVLLYAGSLSYGRDLRPVMRAIAERDGVVLRYLGPHGDVFMDMARDVDVVDRVEDHGLVDRATAQAEAASAHANIVVVSPAYDYAYPGKIFDLASAGARQWLLAPASAAATTLYERHGLGLASTGLDTAADLRVLDRVIAGDWPARRALAALSIDTMVERYERLLRSVCSGS